MAALLAPDVSTISNVEFLDRGYEDFVAKLVSLGADIARVAAPRKGAEGKGKAALQSLLPKPEPAAP